MKKLNLQISCGSQSLEALQNLQAEGDKESLGKQSMCSECIWPPSCMRWLYSSSVLHEIRCFTPYSKWSKVSKSPSTGEGRGETWTEKKKKKNRNSVKGLIGNCNLLHYFQGRLPSRQITAPPQSTRHEIKDFYPREIKWTREKILTLRLIFHSFQVLSKICNLILFS